MACVLATGPIVQAQTSVQESGLRSCFDFGGTEVTCPGTGQDGDVRPGAEWPVPRLVDNGDGTVTDRLTDLMWLKDAGCIDGVDSPLALILNDLHNGGTDFSCDGYSPGTYADWRVPNVVELTTLIDYGSADGLPQDHPFSNVGMGGCFSWSSTSNAVGGEEDEAWTIAHGVAGVPEVTPTLKTVTSGCLWPVRDSSVPAGGVASVSLADGGVRFADGSVQETAVSPSAARPRRSGQVGCWDSTGSSENCAATGQDGELQAGVEWPEPPRYVDNGNGTVTDDLTGMMWLKEPGCAGIESLNFTQAEAAVSAINSGAIVGCTDYTPGTFEDWRMPSITEMASMLDYGTTTGLPAGHPFDLTGLTACGFWSSTSDLGAPTQAWWLVHGPTALDRVVASTAKSMDGCVWVVRESG